MKVRCQHCKGELKAKTAQGGVCVLKGVELEKIWIIRKQTCRVVVQQAHLIKDFNGVLSAVTMNGTTYTGDGVEFFRDHGEAVLAAGIQKAEALDKLRDQELELERRMWDIQCQLKMTRHQKGRLTGPELGVRL